MFLVHPTLTTENMEYSCRVIEEVMALASIPRKATEPYDAPAKGAAASR